MKNKFMLKKFNTLCEETLNSFKDNPMKRRLEKCYELYDFNVKLEDLDQNDIETLNTKIQEGIKKSVECSISGRSMYNCVNMLFYHDGRWVKKVNQRFSKIIDDNIGKIWLSKDYFKNDDVSGELEIKFEDIIMTNGGGYISTDKIIKCYVDKIFDDQNVKNNSDKFNMSEELTPFINNGLISKDEIIKSFFNKKSTFIKQIYLRDVLKISNGEDLLKKYFNIDTSEPKFKEAVEDSKMSIEAQCHSYTINLNLIISIKFDLDKEFSEQE